MKITDTRTENSSSVKREQESREENTAPCIQRQELDSHRVAQTAKGNDVRCNRASSSHDGQGLAAQKRIEHAQDSGGQERLGRAHVPLGVLTKECPEGHCIGKSTPEKVQHGDDGLNFKGISEVATVPGQLGFQVLYQALAERSEKGDVLVFVVVVFVVVVFVLRRRHWHWARGRHIQCDWNMFRHSRGLGLYRGRSRNRRGARHSSRHWSRHTTHGPHGQAVHRRLSRIMDNISRHCATDWRSEVCDCSGFEVGGG
eukprot:2601496-Rhodomonas_salina.4